MLAKDHYCSQNSAIFFFFARALYISTVNAQIISCTALNKPQSQWHSDYNCKEISCCRKFPAKYCTFVRRQIDNSPPVHDFSLQKSGFKKSNRG